MTNSIDPIKQHFVESTERVTQQAQDPVLWNLHQHFLAEAMN